MRPHCQRLHALVELNEPSRVIWTARPNLTTATIPQTTIKQSNLRNYRTMKRALHTNQQLNEIAITGPNTNEKYVPNFSSVTLKKNRKMLFAPMDFNNRSMDALTDSRALVNCLPENEFQKIKSISPDNIVKGVHRHLNFRLQIAT